MAKSFAELTRRTMSKTARSRAEQRANEILASMLLAELRTEMGTTQKELASRIGVAQPTLARMEKQNDMQITTLQRIVEALGGNLTILADFPRGTIAIRQFDEPVKPVGKRLTRHSLQHG